MKGFRILISIVFGLLGVMFFLSHTVMAARNVQKDIQSSLPWSRNLEPVIITGSQVTLFSGVDIATLYAYAYSGGEWTQIPLQIDEVNSLGEYSIEDGLLDENDELVFLAKDIGEKAGETDWIGDSSSKNNHRYQLQITNPLTPTEVGYVYLYQSDTISPTHVDYIDWVSGTQEIVSEIYSMGIITSPLQREESLILNGNDVDVLDRSKYRLRVRCRLGGVGPFIIDVNEDYIEAIFVDFYNFEPNFDGPVRVGGGSLSWKNWSYPAMRTSQFGINFDFLSTQVCEFQFVNFGRFEEFRFSFDWLDPLTSTMRNYYDSNHSTAVDIDGSPDLLAVSPLKTWSQVSGDYGSVVRLTNLSQNAIGEYQNYYKDDSSIDYDDTGDQMSYGDSGFLIEFAKPPEPAQNEYGTLEVDMVEFFLGPNSPNVGQSYLDYKENPFQVLVTSQEFYLEIFFPMIFKGNTE